MSVKDDQGYTPFLLACKNWRENQDEVLETFMKHKDIIDYRAKANDGFMALDLALLNCKCTVKTVKVFIKLQFSKLNSIFW